MITPHIETTPDGFGRLRIAQVVYNESKSDEAVFSVRHFHNPMWGDLPPRLQVRIYGPAQREFMKDSETTNFALPLWLVMA